MRKFTDVDECIDFITDIEDEKIFMICSGELGKTKASVVYDIAKINCIYIFCKHKERHEQWAKEWSKIKGVYTDITPICEAWKHAAQDCDHKSIFISFVKLTDGVLNEYLDWLD